MGAHSFCAEKHTGTSPLADIVAVVLMTRGFLKRTKNEAVESKIGWLLARLLVIMEKLFYRL
jgi:hypothetical protein